MSDPPPVERRDLKRRISTVGNLDYDEERMVSVTTRYSGFIEKVFVNHVGQPVRRGDPLFEVYSPELVQTQRELISAVSYAKRFDQPSTDVRARAEGLVEAARTRLEYWEIPASTGGRDRGHRGDPPNPHGLCSFRRGGDAADARSRRDGDQTGDGTPPHRRSFAASGSAPRSTRTRFPGSTSDRQPR